jgi:hypothetical protein
MFLTTTAIYIYVYVYLKKRLAAIQGLLTTTEQPVEDCDPPDTENTDTSRILPTTTLSVCTDSNKLVAQHVQYVPSRTSTRILQARASGHGRQDTFRLDHRQSSASAGTVDSNRLRHIKLGKILLLSAYPFLYIILWIPDIANRLAESLGYKALWLTTLQATGQYIGLANAVTYGYNEHWKRRRSRVH